MKKRLVDFIYEKFFKYSEEPVFRLISRRASNYYVNYKTVMLHPDGMYGIGNIIIFEMIKNLLAAGIGSLTFGADPISNSVAVACTSYLKRRPIEAFVLWKRAKGHGTMQ